MAEIESGLIWPGRLFEKELIERMCEKASLRIGQKTPFIFSWERIVSQLRRDQDHKTQLRDANSMHSLVNTTPATPSIHWITALQYMSNAIS